MAALTGTADPQTLKIIISQLALKNPLTIYISPNRRNLHFSVIKEKRTIFSRLHFLIGLIKEKGLDMGKTIIFCNTLNDIAAVANYLMLHLGKDAFSPPGENSMENCLIGIYHSTSWPSTKEHITKSLKGQGKVRVVVATTALSMGVNFPNIRHIINWGPPRDLLDFHQEAGRAGRDNLQSHVIVLYYGQQVAQCDNETRDFVKATGCLRKAAYKPLDNNIASLQPGHKCCSYCQSKCDCSPGNNCNKKLPLHQQCHNILPSQERLTRPVAEDDKVDVKGALVELCNRVNSCSTAVFDPTSSHGFSKQLIYNIVASSSRLFSVADILECSPVFYTKHALYILEIIQEIFLDIPNFDETMELLQSNSNQSLKDTTYYLEVLLADLSFDDIAQNSSDGEEDQPEVLGW